MKISFVIPVFNEEENLRPLLSEIAGVAAKEGYDYEVICVDDGSKDRSLAVLREAAGKDQKVKIIAFRFNAGQTAAMSAGITNAKGDVVIPLDADLQNDPASVPALIKKIQEGFDVVSGWRKDRQDNFFVRTLPSRIANWLIGVITGLHLHDYGCSLKAYKRELLEGVRLYGEMHRFIPAYAYWHGAKVTEVVVNHRPRAAGATNYGISRTFRVLLDLVVLKFLSKYMNRPMHFFGGVGFISLFLGVIVGLIAIYLKIAGLRDFVATPLPVFSALLIIVGVQLVLMGVIAEILMRIYYESQNKTPYIVKETFNI